MSKFAALCTVLLSLVGVFVKRAAAQPVGDATPAAIVDGSAVPLIQVRWTLFNALHGRTVPPAAMPMLQAQSLEQAIHRRLVLAKLKALKYEPTAEELKTAEENLQTNLAVSGVSREEYLKRSSLREEDLDDIRYWDICWNRYCREQLHDAALEKYFAEHRRDFDGTELRVSHILLRVEGRGPQGDVTAVIESAGRLREEIVAGKLTFAAAAAKHSAGPSREQGGDLGFIPRRDLMVEEFSAAAFRLQIGEISPPVVTTFGVHLITVTEDKPGTVRWSDVRDRLYLAAQNDLFRTLAAELRKTAKVEYTGAMPHLDPATGRVVPARNGAADGGAR